MMGMPITSAAASLVLYRNMNTIPPTSVKVLRNAIDITEPTTCSMIVVSAVSREAISAGEFSSKKGGESVRRLSCTSVRISATIRSATQETMKNRTAVARPRMQTRISKV